MLAAALAACQPDGGPDVSGAEKHDTSRPLREIEPVPQKPGPPRIHEVKRLPPLRDGSADGGAPKPDGGQTD